MAGGSLTRADIEAWSTEHLDTAATHWTSAAQSWEEHFTTIHNGMLRPGGTTWEGAGADAAAERSWMDLVVVRGAADALHSASGHATNGSGDVAWAKRQALNAIAEAEEDGFTVGQDFSVEDTRMPSLLLGTEDRQSKATEHAHAIQAAVQRLVDADKQAADRIHGALSPLNGLTFPGQGDGKHDPTVKAVDNKTTNASEPGKGQPGDKPAEQATGQVGPFAVPKEVEDAAKRAGAIPPDVKAPDSPGLGSLLGNDDSLERTPGNGHPGNGLPPIPGNVPPPPPDKAAIDRQAAKVESARQDLAAAQAKVDASVNQAVTSGPYNGHDLNDSNPLARELFDARHNLTEQTRALQELNYASGIQGGPTVPVPPLPEHTDMQAFPPGPSLAERAATGIPEGLTTGSRVVHDITGGLVPDVAKGIHTGTHWGEASPADRAQLIGDAAGMVPLPGMKIAGEALEHGLAHYGAEALAHGAPPVVGSHVPVSGEHGGSVHAPDAPVSADHGLFGNDGNVAAPSGGGHGDGLNHVNVEAGGAGNWNHELNNPQPNTHYTVDGQFQYTTDHLGRSTEMEAPLALGDADRNGYQQLIAGGSERLPGDHGGHTFGVQFGAPGEAINITAMDGQLNLRGYAGLESEWKSMIQSGHEVYVKVNAEYPGSSMRPDAYSVRTYVDGKLYSTRDFDN